MLRKLLTASFGLIGILFLAQLVGRGSNSPFAAQPAAAVPAANAAAPALSSRTALQQPTPMPTVLVMLLPTAGPAATSTPEPADAPAASPAPEVAVLAAPARVDPPALGARGQMINGVRIDSIVVLSNAARQHIREIFAKGQELGRDAHALSKIGDSTMAWPPFLADFGRPGAYALGPYTSLQPTIDHYGDSLARTSAAVKKGMHTWTEFDPSWAPAETCAPGEGPLACEVRLHNPSVAIIRLGANDAGALDRFDVEMRRIVDFCLERGIIPVLGTKPDRVEGADNTINGMVHRIAAEYRIPLWDYDLIAATVPGKGLEPDHVHMRAGETHDFNTPQAFQSGDPLEDLTALMMLDAINREVAQPAR